MAALIPLIQRKNQFAQFLVFGSQGASSSVASSASIIVSAVLASVQFQSLHLLSVFSSSHSFLRGGLPGAHPPAEL